MLVVTYDFTARHDVWVSVPSAKTCLPRPESFPGRFEAKPVLFVFRSDDVRTAITKGATFMITRTMLQSHELILEKISYGNESRFKL